MSPATYGSTMGVPTQRPLGEKEDPMTTTLLERRPVLEETAPIALVRTREPESVDQTATTGREMLRWVRWLGIPFVLAAAFFAAAIGTGQMWLMGFAWGFGPELLILGYIYLSLTSEANTELLADRKEPTVARSPLTGQ
jgi:hypothetical protein